MRRLLAPLAIAALAVAALAGCSSPSPAPSGSAAGAAGCAPAKNGSVSDAVKVSGDLTSAPTVSFTAPLKVTSTQRTVVTEGKGAKAGPSGLMQVDFTLYDGTTDKVGGSTGHGSSGQPVLLNVDTTHLPAGFVKTLDCAAVGSRIVGVIPAKDGLGTTGEQLGIPAKDTLVLVADVVALVPSKADGAAQPAPAGFPTVKLAKSGQPTVTIPKADAPTDLKVGVLKKGDGPAVASGDTVTLQYQGSIWATGKVFDQSWGKGGPTALATDQVVPGFGQALVGQTVGSQVIAIIPPALGYGPQGGNSQAGIGKDDTIVFVIDILATQPTPAS